MKSSTEHAAEAPRAFPVVPIAFSSDETGVGFGILYNRVLKNGSTNRPDSVQAYTFYTTKDQYSVKIKPSFYFDADRFHLSGSIFTSYTPSTFWGIGREAGDSDDQEEDFTSTTRGVDLVATARIMGPYRAGISTSWSRLKISDKETGGLLLSGSQTGADGGQDVSVGLLLQKDSRDSTFWPMAGEFCQLEVAAHRYGSGSDFNYNRYHLDLRAYRTLSEKGLLALRFVTLGTTGKPPFYALPQLGGSRLLRGLYGGRYRDRWLYAFQLEYRSVIGERFSWTLFTAIGNIADGATDLLDTGPLLTGGAGLRFALDPENRVNLRVDVGISKHGLAPMVMINEAF